jgi:hypothetical protein
MGPIPEQSLRAVGRYCSNLSRRPPAGKTCLSLTSRVVSSKGATLRGPRPRPLNAHPPPTERHLTSLMAVTHSGPLGVPGLLPEARCCSSPRASLLISAQLRGTSWRAGGAEVDQAWSPSLG